MGLLQQFQWYNYALIILTIFIHYPIGHWFAFKRPIMGSLVGICVSALIVSVLANTCAGLIKYYLLGTSCLLGPLMLLQIYQNLKHLSKEVLAFYALILALLACFFFINNPARVFIGWQNDQPTLLFNEHYTYFSSQSVEMLNADYFSRLRVLDLYPKKWGIYHFFNASVQAIAQQWFRTPNLFSYFMAQVILGIFVLASILEHIFIYTRQGHIFSKFAQTGFWLYLGFSIFRESLVWTLSTTGMFSVFAATHFIFSLLDGTHNNTKNFLTLLGASAFRLVPVASALWCILTWFEFRESGVNFFRHKRRELILFSLLMAYIVVTLVSGERIASASLSSGTSYTTGWMYILTLHSIMAFISSSLGLSLFQYHDPKPIFLERLDALPLVGILLLAAIIYFIWQKVRENWQWLKKYKKWTFAILLLAALTPRLSVLAIAYATLIWTSLNMLKERFDSAYRRKIKMLLCVSLLITYLFIAWGSNGITTPVSYTTWDLFLWGILYFVISNCLDYKRRIHQIIVVACLALFSFKVDNIFKYPTMLTVDLKDFASSNLFDYKNKQHFLNSQLANSPALDSKTLEAYSALFGARTEFRDSFKNHRNYEHAEQ